MRPFIAGRELVAVGAEACPGPPGRAGSTWLAPRRVDLDTGRVRVARPAPLGPGEAPRAAAFAEGTLYVAQSLERPPGALGELVRSTALARCPLEGPCATGPLALDVPTAVSFLAVDDARRQLVAYGARADPGRPGRGECCILQRMLVCGLDGADCSGRDGAEGLTPLGYVDRTRAVVDVAPGPCGAVAYGFSFGPERAPSAPGAVETFGPSGVGDDALPAFFDRAGGALHYLVRTQPRRHCEPVGPVDGRVGLVTCSFGPTRCRLRPLDLPRRDAEPIALVARGGRIAVVTRSPDAVGLAACEAASGRCTEGPIGGLAPEDAKGLLALPLAGDDVALVTGDRAGACRPAAVTRTRSRSPRRRGGKGRIRGTARTRRRSLARGPIVRARSRPARCPGSSPRPAAAPPRRRTRRTRDAPDARRRAPSRSAPTRRCTRRSDRAGLEYDDPNGAGVEESCTAHAP